MGSDSNKHVNKRHIYDELNKSIDSFTSCDDYSHSDDDNKKQKQNKKSKKNYKLKYKIKKHKNINDNEMNIKFIESSLQVSNFLINNIINKDIGERLLPDTNLLNSLIMYPDFFQNEELQLKNQKEYCDKMIFNGLKKYKKEYKIYEINKRSHNLNNEYFYNNPVSKEKIYVNNIVNNLNDINNEKINEDINTPFEYKKSNLDKMKSRNKDNNSPNFIEHVDRYQKNIYNEKKNKKYIKKDYFSQNNNNNNKNNNSFDFNDNPFKEESQNNTFKVNLEINEINSKENENNIKIDKKIYINKGKNIRKKVFLNKKVDNIFLSKNYKNSFNSNNNDLWEVNIKNKNNLIYNGKINRNDINIIKNNLINKNDISPKKINVNINKNVKRKIKIYNNDDKKDKRSKTIDSNKSNNKNINIINNINKSRHKDIFSHSSNYIEKNNSFDISNNKHTWENNKIEKSSNFNIKKNQKNHNINPNNNNNNIEFKSEFKKSQLYFRDNNDDEIIDELTKSSLKDFLNKETKIIKENPSYIKSKKNGQSNKKEINNIKLYKDKDNEKNDRKSHNPFLDNSNDYELKKNFNDNISYISPKYNNDISVNSIKSKLNKFKSNNESIKKTVLKIDLRKALAKIENKKKYNNSNDS